MDMGLCRPASFAYERSANLNRDSTTYFAPGPLLRKMSDHEFFEICQLNQDLRIERTSEGDLIIRYDGRVVPQVRG